MIIFHEGLPGSGKSYEACVNQIIPALLRRREVFAYIEGLNHEKFADVTGLDIGLVRGLLYPLQPDDIQNIHKVNDNALVIIDELQNFFPVGSKQLSPEITKFITEHRHRGLDIVCMGQDHRDCHMLWKRRIDQLIHFVKRDAIGNKGAYTWKAYKLNQGKFIKLRSGKGKYDSKYFGLYASHVSFDIAADDHDDKRFNIFASNTWRYAIPAFVVVFVFAISFLVSFFSDDTAAFVNIEKSSIKKPVMKISDKQLPNIAMVSKSVSSDFLVELLSGGNRLRLSGVFVINGKMDALFEIYDSSVRLLQRFRVKELEYMGWSVQRLRSDSIVIKKPGYIFFANAWPFMPVGQVSRDSGVQDQLRSD